MKKSDQDRDLAKKIGQIIAKIRNARGITQEEVAERLGVGYEAVSRLERGVTLPTIARLIGLAEVLSCPIDSLLIDSSNRIGDQAEKMARLLSGLSEDDRRLVLGMVEKLSQRLLR